MRGRVRSLPGDPGAVDRWQGMLGRSGSGAEVVPGLGRGERSKGIWWMPWRREAMKDVARCDKPRGGASTR